MLADRIIYNLIIFYILINWHQPNTGQFGLWVILLYALNFRSEFTFCFLHDIAHADHDILMTTTTTLSMKTNRNSMAYGTLSQIYQQEKI